MSITLQSPAQLPLQGSVLIEASAGTGKTYTIAALYVRFILAHVPRRTDISSEPNEHKPVREKPLLPADILVVTFTKAATAELKDRIRKRLVEAAQVFKTDTLHPDPFLNALKAEFAAEYWPSCSYALQLASEAMDEASIKTIHSWCQSVLREHAFSSGSLFSQQLLTDLEVIKLDAARDYWRNFVYPLSANDYQLFTQVAATPHDLLSRINGLWDLATPVTEPLRYNDIYTAALAQHQAALGHAHASWQSMLKRYFALIDKATELKWFAKPQTHNGKKARSDLQPIADWLALPESVAMQQLPQLKDSVIKNFGKEFLAHYHGEALTEDFPAALLELQQLLTQQPDIRPALFQHAVSWCKARVEQQLQRDAVMGFNDIIQQSRRAIAGAEGEALAALLRAEYPVAMIDEFQDTDPDQYQIFNAVYQLAANRQDIAVFLIGDPKQAIYAFRGADIFTYLQARRDTQGRHYTLATNFRSSQALVAAVNAVFSHAEQQLAQGAFLFNSEAGNEVPFVQVAANDVKQQLWLNAQPSDTALTVWSTTASQLDNEANDSKALSKEKYRQSQAEVFSDYIVQLLQQAAMGKTGFVSTADLSAPLDQLPPITALKSGDIAILVATHSEGHLMQQALRKRGLPSVYLSDRNSVFESEVASDLLLVLRACAEPANKQAIVNALHTQLLKVALVELDALQHDDWQWEQQVSRFYQYAECWQQQGVLPMIRLVMQHFNVAEKWLCQPVSSDVTENTQAVAGERYLTDLLHLAELLQQASARLDGTQAVIRFLHEHIYQPDQVQQPAEEQIVRLESDADLIQIVTIHKSKGLEYPLVFLPFISLCRPVSAKDAVFNYHNDEGVLCQSITASPAILAQAEQERLGEDIRKLYVALTRAKYACWVSLAPAGEWQKSALAYLFGATKKADGAEFIDCAKHYFTNTSVLVAPVVYHDAPLLFSNIAKELNLPTFSAREMPAQHKFEAWWVASYSALKYGALREPDSPLEHNLVDEQEDTLLDGATLFAETSTLPITHTTDTLHDLPRGAGPGTFLHNILQDAAEQGFVAVAHDAVLRQGLLAARCRHGVWASRREMLDNWLQRYLQTPFNLPEGGAITLAQLTQYKAEPEFWFAVAGISTRKLDELVCNAVLPGFARPGLQPNYLNGMLKGYIDLLFEHNGRYYVVDYKSNYLGADNHAYQASAMRDKILASRYDMQYVLYTLALHKLLKARLGEAYSYEQHVGGVMYLFLRGHAAPTAGVYTDKPPKQLIEALDQYFTAGQTKAIQGVQYD